MIREKGINNHLVNRIEEVYEETINRVLIEGKHSKDFWTESGVRQGWPTLFAIYIKDIKEILRKGQVGGIVIGRKKLWTLSYTDDMVLLTRNTNKMKKMLKTFARFLKKRELNLNTEKSKIMTFRRGKERKKKER